MFDDQSLEFRDDISHSYQKDVTIRFMSCVLTKAYKK
jgi:hypothetical protein